MKVNLDDALEPYVSFLWPAVPRIYQHMNATALAYEIASDICGYDCPAWCACDPAYHRADGSIGDPCPDCWELLCVCDDAYRALARVVMRARSAVCWGDAASLREALAGARR